MQLNHQKTTTKDLHKLTTASLAILKEVMLWTSQRYSYVVGNHERYYTNLLYT